MDILTILVCICLAFLAWVLIKFIAEEPSNLSRQLAIIPFILVATCTILAHVTVMYLQKEIEKLESKKIESQYEQVTETFYRKIK